MDTMIQWNDCTPLTREEFDDFINTAVPFLQGMEDKNGWDFIINDMRFSWFCERFLLEAFKLNNYERYQHHCPKVQDMHTICGIIVEANWTEEDEAFKNDHGICIWKTILSKVNDIANSVF